MQSILTMPSLWNLITSFLAFFIATWMLNRYMDHYSIPKNLARKLAIFILSIAISSGVGNFTDWLIGEEPKMDDLTLKAIQKESTQTDVMEDTNQKTNSIRISSPTQ